MTLIEDTDHWQDAFFVLVLASVVVINVCGAIFQGGLLGLVGKFPPQYIGGTLTGQGLKLSSTFLRREKINIINCVTFSFFLNFSFTRCEGNCGSSALVPRWHLRQRNKRDLHRGRRRRCARRLLLLLHGRYIPRLGTRRLPLRDQVCIRRRFSNRITFIYLLHLTK